jgi:hypothetical protein
MNESRSCKAHNQNNNPCGSPALLSSEFCFFHSPETADKRLMASSTGGAKTIVKMLPVTTASSQVNNACDILKLVAETIHHVRTGQLDPRIANCVGYLSGIALKAIEQGKIEDRIAALEITVKNNDGEVQKDYRKHNEPLSFLDDQERI